MIHCSNAFKFTSSLSTVIHLPKKEKGINFKTGYKGEDMGYFLAFAKYIFFQNCF